MQLEIIHEYVAERGTDRVTWIIIWLIVVACLVEFVRILFVAGSAQGNIGISTDDQGEVLARLLFHKVPRETGQFLLVKASKAIMGL